MPPVLADITQGHRLARLPGDGYSLHEIAYPAAREMPSHSHRTANITILLAGAFEEQVDHSAHRCRPLSVILKPAGAVHATSSDPGVRSLVLELCPDLEEHARRSFGLLDRCRVFHTARPIVICLLSLWQQLRAGAPVPGEILLARIAESVGRCTGTARAAPGIHVRRALRLLETSSSPPTSSHLAEELGLHPVYLARLFRERTGATPTQHRIRRQVQHAVDSLVRTTEPLSAIALHAGFADQAHLCRRVKRETGVSPGALRRLVTPV